MPNYVLPPSQPLPSTLRSLRHSLGQPIHPTGYETFPPSTTHVLLTRPIPCLALLIALIDPSIHLVTTSNDPYNLPNDILPPSASLLWAGPVPLATRTVWHTTEPALRGLRIATVGALRPRGAGTAAPSTDVVKTLVRRAGGVITDNHPDIALVPPGTRPRGRVSQLLDDDVLCLGAGFVIDLLLRVHANPHEYLVFPQQRHLCGPVIDVALVKMRRPLPVSKSVERSSENALVTARIRVRADVRRSTRIRAQGRDESNNNSVRMDQPTVLTRSSASIPEDIDSNGDAMVVDIAPTAAINSPSHEEPAPSTPTQQTKRSGQLTPRKASTAGRVPRNQTSHANSDGDAMVIDDFPTTTVSSPTHEEPAPSTPAPAPQPKGPGRMTAKKASRASRALRNQTSQGEITHPKRAPSNVASHPKRPRRMTSKERNVHVIEEHSQTSKPSVGESSNDGSMVVDDAPTTTISSPSHEGPAPSTPMPQSKESGQMTPRKASRASRALRNQTSQGEITRPKRAPSKAASHPKRPRQIIPKERNVFDIEGHNQTSPPPVGNPRKPAPQPHDLISPTTPADNLPKRPQVGNINTKKSSSGLSSGRSRPPVTSSSDADTIPPRQLHFPPEDANCDMSLPAAPFSHGPRSSTGSIISGRVDGHSFSVDEGYRFLFARLGQPSQAEVDRLLRSIKNEGDSDDDEDQRKERSADNIMVTGTQGVAHRSNPRGAESPLFEEEEEAFTCFHEQPERVMDDTLDGMGDVDTVPSLRRFSRSEAAKREALDAFRIPVPRQRKILSNVIRPEMAVLERANEINIMEGNDLDDQTCQDSIVYMDWILGAENFVGVSRDATCSPHKGPVVARCRRLWSSLFESDALRRLAAPTGLPDSDIRTLMGVCIRLLSSGLADDMKVTFSEKLLIVRDEQMRAGFDSLQIVLSSRNLGEVPLRHKALAAIWTTLVQSSTSNDDFTGAWEVLNEALIPRVDGILNHDKFKDCKRPHYLEKELTNVLQNVVLTSYMFSTKLDFSLGDETDEKDLDEARLRPENWPLVCHCMDKLCEVASLPEHRSMALIMSTSFFRMVSINIGGKVWPVTDKVVGSASKMVAKLSSLNGKNCFCVAPPMIVNQFRTLADDSNSHRILSDGLKTMCDYLFLLGWLYTVRGQGNPMKRAMNVIRSGSSFTRSTSDCPDSFSRSINHHVGLLLTVADSLASSAKDGEYLLCKMLTSKCPRPKSIAERLSNSVGEQDIYWRATLRAISRRCEDLLARQLSVHVYTVWLSKNLVETLWVLRRSSERRPANLSEKEAFRAQDSVFCNLAMLMISSLTKVNKSIITWSHQDGARDERIIREAIEKPAAQISTFMKVSGELISQIRSNPEESISKNRHGLLCALLSLVESQIVLVRHLLAPPLNETGSLDRISRIQMLDDRALSFITDNTTEHVVVNVVGGGQPVGDESTLRDAMRTAAGILAHLIELQSVSSSPSQAIHGNEDKRTTLLQRANMDVTNRFEGGPQRGVPTKPASPEVEDRCRLFFWSEAVRSSWILSFLQRRGRSHVMCISAVLALLASMSDDWDTEDSAATIRLGKDCLNLEPLRYVFGPIRSEVSCLDKSDHPLARVEVVEKAIRVVVKHWPVTQVRGLLKLLDWRLKHITGSRLSIQADALILYCFTNAVSAQLGGFTHARFLHSPLGDIAQAISRMTNSARDHSKTFHLVQTRVLSALCMATSDMETRVLVLRVANAFPASDTLPGLWGAPLLPTDEVPEGWTRRAERHAQEWRGFVFTGVVEDPLFAGRNVAYVVRRLAAAAKGGDAMRRLVQGVLVRGRGKLDFLLRRDGRAWREWSALCDGLLEA